MITRTEMVPLASGGMLPPGGGGRHPYPYPSPEDRFSEKHGHHSNVNLGEQFVDLKVAKKGNSQLRAEKANRKGK
jgi:hypothetical protein